jgi:hypothetical protein
VAGALLPKPSAFSAANSECTKPCSACCGLLAAVAALPVAAVALVAVVALDAVVWLTAGVVVVAGVSAEAATDAIGLLPITTCSIVDSRLLNNPCVDEELELDVADVESVPDSVLASGCTLRL